MIDSKNRLCKLVGNSPNLENFVQRAVNHSSWYLKPWVEIGNSVTRKWIEDFWKSHKGV